VRVACRRIAAAALLCSGTLVVSPCFAGGLLLYEVGTDDVGLASAGYNARAQDASTVLTNPAGMTRLEGNQALVGAQALYGDFSLSMNAARPGFSAGGDNGGGPLGWTPGGGLFLTHSVSRDLKIGFGATGNFGSSLKYDDSWAGRYYVRQATLIGASLLPSIAYRLNEHLSLGASVNAMYGYTKYTVAVNNVAPGAGDGQLKLRDTKWGWGGNLGLLYEVDPRTRFGFVYNSQVKLDFSPQAQFSGLAPGMNALLASRGLLNSTVDLGVKVPQGVMGSVYHELNDRWALLGSVGWQQWSKFGEVDVSVNSNNPTSLTTQLNFKDTWHVAVGAQYRPVEHWLINFGVAYDSEFQDNSNVSPALPTNGAWRFGVGGTKQETKTFGWGVAAEYIYGGSPSFSKTSTVPVALGGRGDLSGTYDKEAIYILSGNARWSF
jgi:long-chain fatty acid transport protein